MNSKKLIEVAGFQCEPERSEETQGEIYRDNGDEKSEGDTMGQDSRIFGDLGLCASVESAAICQQKRNVGAVKKWIFRYFDISTYSVRYFDLYCD